MIAFRFTKLSLRLALVSLEEHDRFRSHGNELAPITRALDKTGREIEPANVDSYIKTKFSKNYAYVYGANWGVLTN